ncbi:N-6 DNA methylase [Gammaproteobacteria bacterium]|nr:N-6 DNA methylase [Gammaproteobacteria bacterium]
MAGLKEQFKELAEELTSVGPYVDTVSLIQQIATIVFLKLLEQSQMTGDESDWFFTMPDELSWSAWSELPPEKMHEYLNGRVLKNLATQNFSGLLKHYFDEISFTLSPHDLNTLVQRVKAIEVGDHSPDVTGEIVEGLLSGSVIQARTGLFRTPSHIRRMMVEMIAPRKGETILDPASGTGGFLIDCHEEVLGADGDFVEEPIYGRGWLENNGGQIDLKLQKEKYPNLQVLKRPLNRSAEERNEIASSFKGIEISRQINSISAMNFILHGLKDATLSWSNALTEDWTEGGEVDVIIANPPFGGKVPIESLLAIDQWRHFGSSRVLSEVAFLSKAISELKIGGRCAIILPEGLLSRTDKASLEVRERLLDECEIQAIVSLPAEVFQPYTSVRTVVLMFQKVAPYKTYSVGAERVLLGQIMLDNSSELIDPFTSDDFYLREHKVIFEVMLALRAENKPVDVVTVMAALNDLDQLQTAGGLDYLSELSANARGDAASVLRIFTQRRLRRAYLEELKGMILSGRESTRGLGDVLDRSAKGGEKHDVGQKNGASEYSAHLSNNAVRGLGNLLHASEKHGEKHGIDQKNRVSEYLAYREDNAIKNIWFYSLESDGYQKTIVSGARKPAPDLNDIPDLLKCWHAYESSNFKTPPGKSRDSIVSEDDVVKSWFIDEDSLMSSNINLSPSHWQPERTASIDVGNPKIKIKIDELVEDLQEQIMRLENIKGKLE